MTAAVGSILTLGLGEFSDINHVVTLGYGIGLTTEPPGIGLSDTDHFQVRAPTDYLYIGGEPQFPISRFRGSHRIGPPEKRVGISPDELKEMAAVYSQWRKAA